MNKQLGIGIGLIAAAAVIAIVAFSFYNPDGESSDNGERDLTPMEPGPQAGNGGGDGEEAGDGEEVNGGTPAIDGPHLETAQELLNGGLNWLLANRIDGGWGETGKPTRPAYTAMGIKALVQHPDFDADSPEVKQALGVLMDYAKPDGGIYDQGYENYCTSIALMALAAVDDPKYDEAMSNAVKFLKGIQIRVGETTEGGEEEQEITEDHPFRGGTSYGHHGRPDLSNLSMTAQAMKDAGVPEDDEFWREAVVFLERTQNRSESNDRAWVADGPDDGGFVYAPATRQGRLATPESKASPDDIGTRSYGSMTYAGFMSMLYAGVDRDDPRVRAAYDWIRTYWRLDSNPNMPNVKSHQGLYYYYHTFAKALRAWGQPVITDVRGNDHNWRHELVDALAERVQDNEDEPGVHWVNEKAERWKEGNPLLATLYSVLALEEALK